MMSWVLHAFGRFLGTDHYLQILFLTYTSPQTFFSNSIFCKNFFFHFLIATIPIFQEIFSYFKICYLPNTDWPLFSAQIMLIYTKFKCFNLLLFFYFSFGDFLISYLTSLLTYFLPHHVCKQFILSFSPCKQSFSKFLKPPSRNMMVRPFLMIYWRTDA